MDEANQLRKETVFPRDGKKWSEEETILAYYYYCQIPFGKFHSRNPLIIRISTMLGRKPGALVKKIGNLASFDPEMKRRGISGLGNASKLDGKIFNRFKDNWEELVLLASEIERGYATNIILIPGDSDDVVLPPGLDKEKSTSARINQRFFRNAVLSAYNHRCCITGIRLDSLLIASHIKPWAESNPFTERTNPSNGLCLNALYDKAFDNGLITVLPDYTILVSSKIPKEIADNELLRLNQLRGQRIMLPNRFVPSKQFLEYHNEFIFEKKSIT